MKIILAVMFVLVAGIQTHGQGIAYFSYGAGIDLGGRLPRKEFTMDLNSDGVNDFRFVGETPFSGGFYLEPQNRNKVLGYPEDRFASLYRVTRLDSGANVSSAPGPNLEWVGYRPQPLSSVTGPYLLSCLNSRDCTGEFAPTAFSTTEGYVGIQFLAEDGLHYGWIRVRGRYYNDGTILDYAYNTVPGQSISAGAVPEPSTWALLCLGAFALWRFRRTVRPA